MIDTFMKSKGELLPLAPQVQVEPANPESGPPLVTVFVVCYNHARFVEECLEGVRQQTHPNLQVIVLDDCSKDDSVAVIDAWLAKHRVDWHFIRHAKNKGICATLNEALRLARGKYISMIATDDVWERGKISEQVSVMESLPETVGVLYSDAYQINESGELLPKLFIEAHRPLPQIPEGDIFEALFDGNFIPAMTTLIRRDCFEIVGNYDETLVFEDWDMWLRISRRFEFKYLPPPTARYRIVGTSMVRTRSAEMEESGDRIRVKCLHSGWLTGQQRKAAFEAEHRVARQAYRDKLPNRLSETALVFRRRPGMKNALLLLCIASGLPYHRFEQFRHLIGSIKQKTGWSRSS
jgi:glycosyltransferase involved in cell wall biosynthesis